MARGFFITGTDTDVGKTTCALGLMRAFKNEGYTVAAMKPVSAGCEKTPNGLRNDDALRLMQESSVELPYEIVNPYAFEPAIAPHIAAAEENVKIDINNIKQAYQTLSESADIVIVEGAGGWLVPINKNETMADVAKALNLDIIQIVGLRLGCLNHALLTCESIAAQNCTQTGWIANQFCIDMQKQQDNLKSLQQRLTGQFLGYIPNMEKSNVDITLENLNISSLLKGSRQRQT